MANEMKVVGLDVAKNVFQVHAVDRRGGTVLRKRLRRCQVAEFFRQQTPCLIGIEATQGAHYWTRVLRALGHEVRLLAPGSWARNSGPKWLEDRSSNAGMSVIASSYKGVGFLHYS